MNYSKLLKENKKVNTKIDIYHTHKKKKVLHLDTLKEVLDGTNGTKISSHSHSVMSMQSAQIIS